MSEAEKTRALAETARSLAKSAEAVAASIDIIAAEQERAEAERERAEAEQKRRMLLESNVAEAERILAFFVDHTDKTLVRFASTVLVAAASVDFATLQLLVQLLAKRDPELTAIAAAMRSKGFQLSHEGVAGVLRAVEAQP